MYTLHLELTDDEAAKLDAWRQRQPKGPTRRKAAGDILREFLRGVRSSQFEVRGVTAEMWRKAVYGAPRAKRKGGGSDAIQATGWLKNKLKKPPRPGTKARRK